MKKYLLSLGAAALLASCSSEPSDFRPGKKVSTDVVYAGGRPTGLYPSNNVPNASHRDGASHGAAGHGKPAEGTGTAHGDGHTDGEMHDMDASEAAATGSENQKSAVGHSATETATPEQKAVLDSTANAGGVRP